MTDRIHALTVILERDLRDDDTEPLIVAIKQIRGVLDVTMHVTDVNSATAEFRARRELGEKIIKMIYPEG